MKDQFLWIIEKIYRIYSTNLVNGIFMKGKDPNLERPLILDIGSGKSDSKEDTNDLTKELLREGYIVHGIDLKKVTYIHPNYFFIQDSFLESKYNSKSFNIVVSCATWQHIGKIYKHSVPEEKVQKKEDPSAPMKFLEEVSRILKENGDFFLTVDVVPSPGRSDTWRWTDQEVRDLLKDYFEIKDYAYFNDGGYTCYALHLKLKKSL